MGCAADFGEIGVDGAQAGVGEVVLDVPLEASAELGLEILEGLFAANDFGFGLADVVGEAVDLVDRGGLLLSAVAAELGERSELVEAFLGVVEPVVGPVQLLLGVVEGEFGLVEGRVPVGRPVAEEASELGALGPEALQVGGGVVDGEAGVGLAAEGVEDTRSGVRWSARTPPWSRSGRRVTFQVWVAWRAAALAGVAGEAFEGGGAEEVDLGPGAALGAVDGAGPGVGAVRACRPLRRPCDERTGQQVETRPSVVDGPEAVDAVDGGDGDDGAVVEALPAGAEGAVDEDPVAGGVVGARRGPSPARSARGPWITPSAWRRLRMRSARSSQSAWETARATTSGGPWAVDVGDDGVGQRFAGGVGGAEVVFPAVVGGGWPGWWRRGRPGSGPARVRSAGSSWRRLSVSGGAGIRPSVAEAGEFGAEAAGPDRLGLVGIPEAPQPGAGGGGHGGEDDLGVGGGDLGHLVEDDDRCRAARRAPSRAKRAMVMAGIPAWRSSPAAWLVAARPTPGGPAVVAATAAACTVVVLPNPAGAISERRAGPAAHRARTASAWSAPRPGASAAMAPSHDRAGRSPATGRGGEPVEVVENASFESGGGPRVEYCGERRPVWSTRRTASSESRNSAVRSSMVVDVEAAGAEGGDLLDDVRLLEPGPARAQPVLGVDRDASTTSSHSSRGRSSGTSGRRPGLRGRGRSAGRSRPLRSATVLGASPG